MIKETKNKEIKRKSKEKKSEEEKNETGGKQTVIGKGGKEQGKEYREKNKRRLRKKYI